MSDEKLDALYAVRARLDCGDTRQLRKDRRALQAAADEIERLRARVAQRKLSDADILHIAADPAVSPHLPFLFNEGEAKLGDLQAAAIRFARAVLAAGGRQ